MAIFHHYKAKKKSPLPRIFLGIFVLALLGWGGMEWKYRSDLTQTMAEISGNFEEQEIKISGSVQSIAENLEEKGLIVSASSFVKYVKREGLDTKIQAGKNTLSADMTIPEISKKLLKAYSDSVQVRIPEGYTLQEVDRFLSEKNFTKKGEFLKCIEKTCDFSGFSFLPKDRKNWEGYFFPATYNIKKEKISAEKIARKMLEGFEVNAESAGALHHPKRSIQELVIMASLIEKESSSHEGDESQMISDALWKRVDEGIPLGVDATIRYILEIKSDALTVKNLNANNPFNTRKHRGLPPHAISNFTKHSLYAAAHPKQNPYYFYLHQNGKIHFGKTNAEHEQNKQKYCGGSCE